MSRLEHREIKHIGKQFPLSQFAVIQPEMLTSRPQRIIQTRRIAGSCLGILMSLVVWVPSVFGAEHEGLHVDSLIRRLPPGALGTIEVAGLESVISKVENSEALSRYLASPLYDDLLKQDAVKKAMAGKAIAEAQLGMNLWQFARTYLGDRIALGVYPPVKGNEPDSVLIVQVKDAGDFSKLLEKLTPLIALAGKDIKITDRDGGGKLLSLKDGTYIIVKERWSLAGKNRELIDQAITNLCDSRETALKDEAAWKSMTAQLGGQHLMQICVNLDRVRELAGKPRLIPDKLDNPLVSLLYGAFVELANGSPYVGTTLDLRENGFTLQSAVSGSVANLDSDHKAMTVHGEKTSPPFIPNVPGRLAAISISRDVSTWYQARERLLEAKLMPEFDKFETGIATFLAGRDFAEDVLPLFTGRVAFVSSPQEFSYLDGKPGVQLPAFGLIFELAKPQEGADIMNLVTQTIMTVANFEASKEKRQPWVQTSESYHDVQINFARYLQKPKGDQLPTAFNFQPASALVGSRFVLSSSLGLCRQLVDSLKDEGSSAEATAVLTDSKTIAIPNFIQELNPAIAADLLEANSSIIQAKSIQSGKTAEQSSRELEALCQLLRQLTPVRFDTVQYPDHMRLEIHGGWK